MDRDFTAVTAMILKDGEDDLQNLENSLTF